MFMFIIILYVFIIAQPKYLNIASPSHFSCHKNVREKLQS